MRPRTARLLTLLVLVAAAVGGCVPAVASAAPLRPSVSAVLPAVAAAHARPRFSIVVRRAPRRAQVLLQERIHARWATRGRVGVAGTRGLTLRWRGLRGRGEVRLRLALVDRRGRLLDSTAPRTVRRKPAAGRVPRSPVPAPPAGGSPPQNPPATRAPDPTPGGPLVLAQDAVRLHSLGVDRWDVWMCGNVGEATAADAADALNAHVVPYYAWLSGGRYQPEFHARGALDGTAAADCESEAEDASAGRDGALIVQTERVSAGSDACASDLTRVDPCAGEPTVLPGNERIAWLGPDQLFGPDAHLSTAVHELGHALTWPHSFTGRLHVDYQGTEVAIEYDDPFDVMGYERLWGTGAWAEPDTGTFAPKATQAFNRISAGWIPDSAMTIHDRPQATYSLGRLDQEGLQVVIVPTADPRAFLTLEARVQRPFDPLPGEGVVVHAVDQRPAACDVDEAVAGCWADSVRESPAPNTPDSLDSLVTVGDSVDVAGVRIAVTARSNDRFTVVVEGAQANFALKPTLCLYFADQCDGGEQGPLGSGDR